MAENPFQGRATSSLAGSIARISIVGFLLIAIAFAIYKFAVLDPDTNREENTAGSIDAPSHNKDRGSEGSKPHTVGAANVPVHPMGLFSGHTAQSAPFPFELPLPTKEEIPAWWEKPEPLTPKELGFLRYLSGVTWQLPDDQWDRFWKVGGNQSGLQSIRFFAAFAGYAAVAVGMRTPAYPGLTSKILLNVIERVLDRRAWSYVQLLWKDKPWYPDPAAHENIMLTGHVLQLMVMYEAMTGDDRFRKIGFDFVWDQETRFHYDLMELVAVTVKQMRENLSGGVACEPSHVFFICNTHPHVALRMLEGLGLGDWSKDRAKWEDFVLNSFYDPLGGGAIKCVYHQDKKRFFPIGYPGTDGWGLMWYSTWARDPSITSALWRITRSRIQDDFFKKRPRPAPTAPPKLKNSADFVSYLTAIVQAAMPPIPSATFLYPAAVASGDGASAARLRKILEKRHLQNKNGMSFLQLPVKFNVGSNANMALGLALENGSNMRHLVQRPLPRNYFDGPLIDDVQPSSTVVSQAYREGRDLILVLHASAPTVLTLRNTSAIREIKGLPREQWIYSQGTLSIQTPGVLTLRIVLNE